ncbi:MAG: transposase [Puniceicoccales bacterium]|nr:transposase [Puniceicoccales bacterium]
MPPYSPHLNPIEQLWANLKRFWRNHAYLSLSDAIITSNYLQD